MAIFTRKQKADKMELYNSVFVTSQIDDSRFNQIKGRMLTGYFKDNELYKVNIEGNGETVYYLLDGDELVGINQAKCASIEIYIEDGKIKEINEFQNPEGVIDPPTQLLPEALRLEGFSWLDFLRPKNVEDIFRK